MAQRTLIDDWLHPQLTALPIPGLRLITDYIDSDAERALVAEIDARPWTTDWRRRVQVYGLGYGGGAAVPAPPLPLLIAELGRRVAHDGLIEREPENAVVNDYMPGIGIAPHRDYGAFGPTVVGISLLAWCVMDLIALDGATKHRLPLPPRSLLVLSGAARSRWKHGIAARTSDPIDGLRVPRQRRLSVTFRTAAHAEVTPV